jgi:hypothetical protein
MLRPTPTASRLAAEASGWVACSTAARDGVGKTDDFRPTGSRLRAATSVVRGRSSGSPIGMSMATTARSCASRTAEPTSDAMSAATSTSYVVSRSSAPTHPARHPSTPSTSSGSTTRPP